MSNQMEELGIVVRADGTVELANGMKLSAEQISNVGKKLDEYGQKLTAAEKGQKTVTAATKEMGTELGNAGEKAAQAGKHLMNGNWKAAAADIAQTAIQSRVLTGSLVGAGVVIGGVVAGLGAVALAAYEGAKAEHALNEKLTLTGNFAGLVTGQLDTMAGSVARNIGGTVGNAREVLAGLVATGRFTATSLQEAGTAAQLLQRYTGETSQQVIKHFEGMGDGVAKWAQKANESYHFLSIEQFKYIQRLEDQGRKQDAMRVTSEALSRHLGGDLTQNLGTLQRAWMGVASWASSAWNAMMGLGKEDSTQQKIDKLTARINIIANSNKGRYSDDAKASIIAGLEGERSALSSDLRQDRRLTDTRSAREQADEKAIADAMKKKNGGKSDAQRLKDRMEAELERLSYDADNALDLMHMSPERRAYTEVQRRLETDFKNGPEDLKAKIDRVAQSRMEQQQEYQAAMDIAKARQGKRNDEYDTTGKGVSEAMAQREQQAHQGTEQLRQETQRLNVDLIRDDQARARAQLQVEADAWRKKIDVQREGSLERQTMENEYAQWLVARQGQLTEQLKPAWQRMVEGWGDSMKMVRDAHDNMLQGVVQSGEEMFTQWARTGKLSARGMVDAIVVEFARLEYRQHIAGPLANFANGIISGILTGGTGDPDGSYTRLENSRLFGSRHTGGIVNASGPFRSVDQSVFANAPRFHGGGIAGDEVPIIAKKKEGIFTQEQMAALAPAGSGPSITYAPQINIDARTDRGEVEQLVGRAMLASQADLLDKLNRRQI